MDTKQIMNACGEENSGAGPTGLMDPLTALDRAFVLPDEEPEQDSPLDNVLQRMCIQVGELGLLFPWTAGREVVVPPRVSRIPNTASWFNGVANVRGGLVPVVDAAAAFGVVRQSDAPVYLLIFHDGEDALGLLIDGLPRVLDVKVSERLASLPPLPGLLEGGAVLAAYAHADRVWLDLNLDELSEALGQAIAL